MWNVFVQSLMKLVGVSHEIFQIMASFVYSWPSFFGFNNET